MEKLSNFRGEFFFDKRVLRKNIPDSGKLRPKIADKRRLACGIHHLDVFNKSQRTFQQLRRVCGCTPMLRVARRRMQRVSGLRPCAGRLIVHGHFARHARFASGKKTPKMICHPNMTPCSTPLRLTLKQNLAIEPVSKHIEGRAAPVGKFVLACAFHKIKAARKVVHGIFSCDHVLFQSCCNRPRRKSHIQQTPGFQHVLLGGRETFNLELDHLCKRIGHAGFDFVNGRALLPAGRFSRTTANQKPKRDKVMQSGDHEEWIAFRSLVNERVQAFRKNFLLQLAAQ